VKHLLLFLSLLTSGHADPPRVRLLSASENSATIRVEKAASENRLTLLVDTLHTAGVHSFTFETTEPKVLKKLKRTWLDSGIKSITITSPQPSSSFPKIDPIEAHATLLRIKDQIDQATFQFEADRKALVSFIHQYGKPERDLTITPADLIAEKAAVQTQLDQFIAAAVDSRLQLATQISFPENPVTRHLKAHRKALLKKKALAATGVGPKHPALLALAEETTATRQLAIDDLASIEEALRLKIYQIDQRRKHLATWKNLPAADRATLKKSHQQKRSAYLTSLQKLRNLQSVKTTATRSLQ